MQFATSFVGDTKNAFTLTRGGNNELHLYFHFFRFQHDELTPKKTLYQMFSGIGFAFRYKFTLETKGYQAARVETMPSKKTNKQKNRVRIEQFICRKQTM